MLRRKGGPSGSPFRVTGVVRIGPVGNHGPVVPAPDPFLEEPGPRITTLGGQSGWVSNGPAPIFAAAHQAFVGSRSSGSGKRSRSIRLLPRIIAAVVMRRHGSSTAGVRRKVDGAPDAGRTDSHDPRTSANKPRRGRFAARRFSFGPCTARFLLSRQKKMGGAFPGKLPASSRPGKNFPHPENKTAPPGL